MTYILFAARNFIASFFLRKNQAVCVCLRAFDKVLTFRRLISFLWWVAFHYYYDIFNRFSFKSSQRNRITFIIAYQSARIYKNVRSFILNSSEGSLCGHSLEISIEQHSISFSSAHWLKIVSFHFQNLRKSPFD